MTVVLLILKWIGIVLLAVLGLALLLLCCPTVLAVSYEKGSLSVAARILWFIRVPIRLDGGKKEKARSKKGPEDKKPEAPRKKPDLPDVFSALWPLLPPAGRFLKRVFSGIYLRAVRVYWPVHSYNPPKTAEAYGRTAALFGAIYARSKETFHMSVARFDVVADFKDEHRGEEAVSFELHAVLLVLVIAAAAFLIEYLKVSGKARAAAGKKAAVKPDGNEKKPLDGAEDRAAPPDEARTGPDAGKRASAAGGGTAKPTEGGGDTAARPAKGGKTAPDSAAERAEAFDDTKIAPDAGNNTPGGADKRSASSAGRPSKRPLRVGQYIGRLKRAQEPAPEPDGSAPGAGEAHPPETSARPESIPPQPARAHWPRLRLHTRRTSKNNRLTEDNHGKRT